MDTNMNREYRIVYSMRIAMELIKLGHRVISTMPNPEDARYIAWIFESDDTFEPDLKAVKGGRRNER